jgi:hypothetical protein
MSHAHLAQGPPPLANRLAILGEDRGDHIRHRSE